MRAFQYNKTELLSLDRELKVRLNALPTLQSKEAALRAEVKRARQHLKDLKEALEEEIRGLVPMMRLWCEFPDLVRVKNIHLTEKNIAGVKVPHVLRVDFEVMPFNLFFSPAWFMAGVEIFKNLLEHKAQIGVQEEVLDRLEYARRKTTQKVNLYEKVQIPAYKEAMLKIKRFLEDEETIAKSSQKILKKRTALEVAA